MLYVSKNCSGQQACQQLSLHWHTYDTSVHFSGFSVRSVANVRAASLSRAMKNGRILCNQRARHNSCQNLGLCNPLSKYNNIPYLWNDFSLQLTSPKPSYFSRPPHLSQNQFHSKVTIIKSTWRVLCTLNGPLRLITLTLLFSIKILPW